MDVDEGSRANMEDRQQYGPLQLSFISTSLLMMLHVPPVLLLGCIYMIGPLDLQASYVLADIV